MRAEEVLGQAVVFGGDMAEHAVDGVAGAIENGRETGLPAPIDLWRDGCAMIFSFTASVSLLVSPGSGVGEGS